MRYLTNILRTNQSIATIHLQNNIITNQCVNHLVSAISQNDVSLNEDEKMLISFNLDGNEISEAKAHVIADCIRQTTPFDGLNFERNAIDQQEIQQLIDLLQNDTTQTTWNFQNKSIDNRALHFITKALYNNTIVTSLDLSNNGINNSGGERIVRTLRHNKHNRVGDVGMRCLGNVLEKNITLNSVDIGWNRITDQGVGDFMIDFRKNRVK
ncbi:unnamed protein product [Adineta ricciae]|uniref:Uncharacterized protein n=1 Tax=Adineta ricciae TaxID=249248 RepID=A0A816EI13_ADIRI|nr:unnamed protein product [Adineta ricciae]